MTKRKSSFTSSTWRSVADYIADQEQTTGHIYHNRAASLSENVFSLRNLCVLRVSAVDSPPNKEFTAETPSTRGGAELFHTKAGRPPEAPTFGNTGFYLPPPRATMEVLKFSRTNQSDLRLWSVFRDAESRQRDTADG